MIVVAMTSWIKRIKYAPIVINKLLEQTIKPDKIYLTLSLDEFVNEYIYILEELLKLSTKSNGVFEILWVKENTKSMKKVFPILNRLNDDDIIITCDDDLNIPLNLIENRLKEFNDNGRKVPISGLDRYDCIYKEIYGGIFVDLIGPTSIFQKKMLNGWNEIINEELINTYNDDFLCTLIFTVNGYYPKHTELLKLQGEFITEIEDAQEDGMYRNGIWKDDEYVLNIFKKRYKELYGIDLFSKIKNGNPLEVVFN